MAKSRYEYVKGFELDDRILPQTFIVVRVDGRGFSRFTDAHSYIKPNDARGLALMAQCAAAIMRDWGEAVLAFGHSDEFSFVFPPASTVFGRRAAKVATGIASQFAATFVFYWSRFFGDKELLYPPTFDARCVAYPTVAIASDYLKWRQVDAYINCMYNEAFWALQQKGGWELCCRKRERDSEVPVRHCINCSFNCSFCHVERTSADAATSPAFKLSTDAGGKTAEQAHAALKGTLAETKHEVLHDHGINFAKLPAAYRRGMTLVRIGKAAPLGWLLGSGEVVRPGKSRGGASKAKAASSDGGASESAPASASAAALGGAGAGVSVPAAATATEATAESELAPVGASTAATATEASNVAAASSASTAVADVDPGVSMGVFEPLAPSVALCFPDYCRGLFLTRLMEAYAPSHS